MNAGRRKAVVFFISLLLILLTSSVFTCSEADAVIASLPLRCSAPEWLNRSVYGSMNAVWRELMGSRVSRQTALEALALVASRLFSGFSVRLNADGIVVVTPERRCLWTVELFEPEGAERLPDECRSWLKDDFSALRPLISELLVSVPPEALQWNSDSFKTQIDSLLSRCFPGWRAALRVMTDESGARLELHFYPKTPLLLAFSVETLSQTIPQLLADTMSERSLEYLSPLIGFPLSWLTFHKKQMLDWLGTQQLSSKWFEALNVTAESTISLRSVAKVTTRFESAVYSLRGWVSAHAGNDSRLQAGVHLGRFFTLFTKTPAEVYVEAILGLEHWKLDGRLGFAFSPFKYVWAGVEGSTEDEAKLWYRLRFDIGRSGYYGWLRYSEHSDLESAIGYRLNRYISLELYYESKNKDRFSVRALGNL